MAKTWRGWLYNEFRRLQRALPEVAGDAKLVNGGSFGMVVAHPDGTLSKVFYRSGAYDYMEHAYRSFYRETHALTLLNNNPIDGIEIPIIIGEPRDIDHPGYLGTYRMTRVSGKTPIAYPDFKTPPEALAGFYDLYESAGSLLGKFHRAVKNLPFMPTQTPEGLQGARVASVPGLDSRTNRALRAVDDYLQTHAKPGVVHGDFHPWNTMAHANNVTGLLDFSFTARSPNIFTDFWTVPDTYMPAFIRGYEESSGERLDPYLLEATALSVHTYLLKKESYGWDRPKAIEDADKGPYPSAQYLHHIERINQSLNNLIPVTGFKP